MTASVISRAIERFGVTAVEGRPFANKAICNLMIVSIILCCVQAALQSIRSGGMIPAMSASVYEYGLYTVINIVLIEFSTIGMFMLVHNDRQGNVEDARDICRILIVMLLASLLSCLIINGFVITEVFYLFQFACVIAYQIFNDPHLGDNAPWVNPFSRKAREAAKKAGIYSREAYIPLNFFNVFWVFFFASIVGLGIETWFRLVEAGILEDRAGLLWGPFSPIYGVGAVLMTVLLNRFWNRNGIVIFVVSAIVGAGFEFFVSWYMQVAFGISAWDYSDAFLNVQGRTDLAHAIAWGALGFLWIKAMLPLMMRAVDAIDLRWRAVFTVIMFSFMLLNATMTMLALDCWSQRQAGQEPQTGLQLFYAEFFDDEWMANRFQTMTITGEGSIHQKLDENLEQETSTDFVGPKLVVAATEQSGAE